MVRYITHVAAMRWEWNGFYLNHQNQVLPRENTMHKATEINL